MLASITDTVHTCCVYRTCKRFAFSACRSIFGKATQPDALDAFVCRTYVRGLLHTHAIGMTNRFLAMACLNRVQQTGVRQRSLTCPSALKERRAKDIRVGCKRHTPTPNTRSLIGVASVLWWLAPASARAEEAAASSGISDLLQVRFPCRYVAHEPVNDWNYTPSKFILVLLRTRAPCLTAYLSVTYKRAEFGLYYVVLWVPELQCSAHHSITYR